jgi:hypothetical protein
VWAPLLFEDEELPKERQRRDPVLPARSSESQLGISASQETDPSDGGRITGPEFRYFAFGLSQPRACTHSLKTDQSGPTFQQVPPPTPLQAKAYQLLNLLPVGGN